MGRIKGSAGNMTGSKVYDKNVMRAKAFEVSNPNTTAQQTERNFFAEVSACVSGVSEAELRSLFGVKPKTMSRRNALTKQVSEAFSIDGTSKTLDFSKLLSIGNGEKVNTPIVAFVNGETENDYLIDPKDFNVGSQLDTEIIWVLFDTDKKQIILNISAWTIDDNEYVSSFIESNFPDFNGYVYPTCAVGGGSLYLRGFGSFIIKTRAEKKGKDISKG